MFDQAVHIFIAILFGAFCVWYVHFRYCFAYWKKRGIPSPPPIFPAGNVTKPMLARVSLFTHVEQIYREFKAQGHRHVGMYFFNGPVYVPIDPEIVKSILISSFDHFVDRGVYLNKKRFPLTGHIFCLEGQEWKDRRKKLAPFFSPARVKTMYDIFVKNAKKLVEVLEASTKDNEVNIKTTAMNYATDVISTSAFGIDANTLEFPDTELTINLKKIFFPHWRLSVATILEDGLANPGNYIRTMHSDRSLEKFFKKFVKQVIEARKGIDVRKDFMEQVLEIKGLDFEDVLAECYVFYLAAFETASQMISCCIHELAYNQELQDKLRQEVFEKLGKNVDEFSYDNVMNLPLLDKMFKETMRMYPAMGTLHRICVKPYKIPGTDITLEKGTPVLVSTLGLHRDPEFFPDPYKFDPERFETPPIPGTYMPFGDGPRFCIGRLLGTVLVKVGLATLIAEFRFFPNPKTPKVLKPNPLTGSPSMVPQEGIYVKITKL